MHYCVFFAKTMKDSKHFNAQTKNLSDVAHNKSYQYRSNVVKKFGCVRIKLTYIFKHTSPVNDNQL